MAFKIPFIRGRYSTAGKEEKPSRQELNPDLPSKKQKAFFKTAAFLFCAGFLFFGAGQAWGAGTTYYVRTDGNDSCTGLANLPYTSGSNCALQTTSRVWYLTFVSTILPGDTIKFKDDQIWRNSSLRCSVSGTSGSPFTYDRTNDGTNAPIISGYSIISSWSDQGGNVWKSSIATTVSVVSFNQVLGTLVANAGAVIAPLQWFWGSSYLYVYSVGDPSTTYTSPGVEANTNSVGLSVWADGDYIVINNLDLTGNLRGMTAEGAHVTVNNVKAYRNQYGLTGQGSGVITFNGCKAYENIDSGLYFGGSATVNFNSCESYSNRGAGGYGLEGEGSAVGNWNYGSIHDSLISHGAAMHSSSVLNMKYALVYGNYNLALATVDHASANVYNSVFYNNGTAVGEANVAWGQTQAGAATNTFKNNIVVGGYYPLAFGNPTYTTLDSDHNLVYSSGTVFLYGAAQTAYTFTNWKAQTGTDSHSINSDPLLINASGADFYSQSTSPAIDSGTDVSLTTDYVSNPIYGTPDIGAYEYQPPYTFASNSIPTTGSVRLYSDGHYRMATASSSSAVGSFSVTPSGGSYYTASTSQYMDITVNSWLTSGTKNKEWTATSSDGTFQTHATSTIYTIGDLLPSTYYQFKADGTASSTAVAGSTCNSNGSCQSNSGNSLTFTYVGGYSTHTFDLTEDVTAPSAFDLSSPTDNTQTSTTRPTLQWSPSSDSESGLAKYQLYVDGVLNVDNIASTTTATTTASVLSDGSHTWYVKAVDNNNNIRQSTHTYTITIDSTAPSLASAPTFGTITIGSIEVIKPSSVTETGSGLDKWQARRNGTTELGFIATTTNSMIDPSLSSNTRYTYDVQFKDALGNAGDYGVSAQKYTLAPMPTNLAGTAGLNSMSLSVDSFTNATAGSSGYYFSRSGANSGWIQTNSWSDTGLSCSTSYTYSVKYRNGDGTETDPITLTKSTNGCLGGGPLPVSNAYANWLAQSVSPSPVGSGPTTSTSPASPAHATVAGINDGDIMKTTTSFDVYIAKYAGGKMFKRLILSPSVFTSYQHLKWSNLKIVSQTTMDQFTTSNLARALGDTKVYMLSSALNANDNMKNPVKQWLNMTAEAFIAAGYDWDSIYVINNVDRDSYTTGTDITGAEVGFPKLN